MTKEFVFHFHSETSPMEAYWNGKTYRGIRYVSVRNLRTGEKAHQCRIEVGSQPSEGTLQAAIMQAFGW